MAGVTTDVCMVGPAISAKEEGFDVQVVCDACGVVESNPLKKCRTADGVGGVRLTSTNAMVRSWLKLGNASRCCSVSTANLNCRMGNEHARLAPSVLPATPPNSRSSGARYLLSPLNFALNACSWAFTCH